jgi:hypothetical protein
MRSHANSAVTFDYGTIATAVVGLVVGVPTETFVAAALPASNFNADGTITIFVPKSAVGSPQPGDLLGAVNGRTFTGDTPRTMTLERSTALIDHTFVKAQTDNAFPAATYTVAGNAPNITISASPTQIHEGASATYTVSASPAPSQSITVAYSRSGTAGLTSDYTLSGTLGKVTIPAGQTSASFTLQALIDTDETTEPASETAIMTLKAGTGYALGTPSTATVTILR